MQVQMYAPFASVQIPPLRQGFGWHLFSSWKQRKTWIVKNNQQSLLRILHALVFVCVCVCETHTIEHLEKIKLETETQKMHQPLSHESQKSEPDASLEFKKRGHAWNWSLWTDSASCRKWSSQVDALLKVPLHSRPCRSRPDLEEEATRSFFKHWKNVNSKS